MCAEIRADAVHTGPSQLEHDCLQIAMSGTSALHARCRLTEKRRQRDPERVQKLIMPRLGMYRTCSSTLVTKVNT